MDDVAGWGIIRTARMMVDIPDIENKELAVAFSWGNI